jgi:uncharacterized protein YkwD
VKGGVERITGKDLRAPKAPRGGVGAEDDCPDVEVQPTPENLDHVSEVIFCLMNAMRANAGLPALAQQDELASASVEHSQDMVAQKYFAHDSLDGRNLVARLTNVNYIPKSGDWVVGENLAWGTGTLATPRSLVNAWMNSPPHRENLLAPEYREVGMGVVFGNPSAKTDGGVTVTTDFGTRPTPVANPPKAHPATTRDTRRARALRRCTKKHGAAKRRCVRAARKRR